jgi:serine/threonine protein kinase
VFDRMVSGLKSREDRLQLRLRELQREMGETTEAMAAGLVSPESPFASGEILGHRYEVTGHLGSGGMGMVYRARDMELNEDVAVKIVRDDLVRQDPEVIQRLKSEIRLARKISHRNVVRTHDLGEWKGTYFVTMEYVKGITVAGLLDRRGRLTVESTLAIGTQLCEALAVAHEQQIIHRDIKPANLIVDHGGVLKVMDFGIARSIEPDTDRHTAAGFIIGTPQYMAPEQLMGGVVDTRSDLFAVGAVLYECLAGRPPFVADSPLTLVAHIIDGNFPKLSELVPDVPRRLEAIVHQQLQLQPEDRIGSARELANLLTELEHGVTAPTLAVTLRSRLPPPADQAPTVLARPVPAR